MAVRKTLDEMIEEAKLRVIELQSRKKAVKAKTKDLTKDSVGIAELITAIDAVAKTHKITVPEVVKQIARIKRTGLEVTTKPRKALVPS